ncbi:ferritin-like fold-containing protein [Micromonospora sp. NBC_01638]|uniref:ferritin-like fold-containing protein n=1 Tax=Micromonospora sp. NBC_01638 TaxID=2975982 RepID=UPI0038676EC1|nr:ferritin-like domain-containing protein [Micromonospora sp. NBC_01638]
MPRAGHPYTAARESAPTAPGSAVADLLGLVASANCSPWNGWPATPGSPPACAAALEEPDRALVLDVLHDSRYADFAAAEIRVAVADAPRVAGRLSRWVRRLIGEALSQAGRVAAERATLIALIGGATGSTCRCCSGGSLPRAPRG